MHSKSEIRVIYNIPENTLNEDEIILSEYSYDNTGRLVQNLLHNQKDTIRYSYDMRSMLTNIRNRHFSERLFYADSLPQYAYACYNGNVSVMNVKNEAGTHTFYNWYDSQNRLTGSCISPTNPNIDIGEQFIYDEVGNIVLLRRHNGFRYIDILNYQYGQDGGNQVLSITDSGTDADRYNTIEYHSADVQADTTMFYDKNGNLVSDADRGISTIRYNILNLPDTIQFINGNQIVNLYDAAGRKYRSVTYTLPVTAVTPIYEIAHYNFSIDTIHFDVTEYTGNIERRYSRTDTTQRVFNTIGYCQDDTFFYAIKDHLGNTNVMVNASTQLPVQSTVYYASGVQMAQSWGKDRQPYLYNGKEFIEAHGYNTYDYGFRGYYATTGRFTSVDPLAEQTPWQSPYAYAGNNFTNAIDWMGLNGLYSCTKSMPNDNILHFIVVDVNGDYIGGVDDDDNSIYVDLDGTWNTNDGKIGLIYVCDMQQSFSWYSSRAKTAMRNGNKFRAISSITVHKAIGKSLIKEVALDLIDDCFQKKIGNTIGGVGNKTIQYLNATKSALYVYQIFENFLQEGYTPQMAYDLTRIALTTGTTIFLKKYGIEIAAETVDVSAELGTVAMAVAPIVLEVAGIAALLGVSSYGIAWVMTQIVNNIDRMYGSYDYWAGKYNGF